MSDKIIQLNEDLIKHDLKYLVRNSVEETLNAVSVGRFSPFRVGLKTPISVNLKSPMHHVCY